MAQAVPVEMHLAQPLPVMVALVVRVVMDQPALLTRAPLVTDRTVVPAVRAVSVAMAMLSWAMAETAALRVMAAMVAMVPMGM